MDYDSIDLCIRSLTPSETNPERVVLDMPSRYDSSPQKPVEVSLTVVDFIQERYNVVMCIMFIQRLQGYLFNMCTLLDVRKLKALKINRKSMKFVTWKQNYT